MCLGGVAQLVRAVES